MEKLRIGHESSAIVGAVTAEGHDRATVISALEQLHARGLLFEERPAEVRSYGERYARQLDMFGGAETDENSRFTMQDNVSSAHIAQIGLGGLGTWIALALAPTGVGRLTLIDGDTVARSNLNRQILYREDAVGRPKVEAAARRLAEVNPDLVVDPRAGFVEGVESANALVPDCDLLIVSADEPFLRIRNWITEVCHERRIPHLFVAAGGVGPLVLPGGAQACWRCLEIRTRSTFPELDQVVELLASARRPRHPQPITPGYHPLMAGVVVLEAVRHCSGFERPRTIGAQLVWDAGSSTMRRTEIAPNPACPNHAGPATS
ncbi:TOMM precursor leader peptide-binding protein [Nonomuraea sp. PA05]|uniref:TOMM precursor leader peptide-binding protein n=1 Tax=Nonomuraea sp. PA05 TaxID=2604466 RepID=UPI0016528AD4|nr:TOMM precursor leader peptide-binding protein [Nonomuraea sp. PA05]